MDNTKASISESSVFKMLSQAFPEAQPFLLEKVLEKTQDTNAAVELLMAGATVFNLDPKVTYPDALKWDVFWTDFSQSAWDWAKITSQMQPHFTKIGVTRNKVPHTVLGAEIVDWFLENTWIRTRAEAEELGNTMLAEKWLETDGSSVKKKKEESTGARVFRDSEELYYWLSSPDPLPPKPAASPRPTINDFERLKFLGKGAFARVWLVEHKATHKLYAMKELVKSHIHQNAESFQMLCTEKEVLTKCANCPFIVNLHYAFQSAHAFHLVLDLIDGGEVGSFLKKKKRFSKPACKLIGAQLITILEFMHERNIMYRDLKPSNLIFDADGHLCLTDFNFATLNAKHGAHNPLGSPAYTAPEVFSGVYGKAVDWWSFGVVMHQMISGTTPYRAATVEEIIKLIKTAPVHFSEALTGSSKPMLQLVLERDEHKRLENAETKLKSHKFFRDVDWAKVKQKKTQSPLSAIEASK